MEILIKLFDVIIPVYVIIGIGYYIGKKDKKFNTEFITNFAAKIGSPAMIFRGTLPAITEVGTGAPPIACIP